MGLPISTPNYVFIVTYGRSGSTLLQSILQSIDGYCIRGENNNILFSIYQVAQKLYQTSNKINDGSPADPSHPWYGANNFNPPRFVKKMVALFIEEILQPSDEARTVGFKEIRYYQAQGEEFEKYLNFITEFFTPCKFVFNMREWHSVAKSGWWIGRDPKLAQKEVSNCDQQFHAYAKKYPDISYLIHYEDYDRKPETIRGLFSFLEEHFDLEKIRKIIDQQLVH